MGVTEKSLIFAALETRFIENLIWRLGQGYASKLALTRSHSPFPGIRDEGGGKQAHTLLLKISQTKKTFNLLKNPKIKVLALIPIFCQHKLFVKTFYLP